MNIIKFAGLLLAIAFFVSCSSDDGEDKIPDERNCAGTEYEPQTQFCFENAIYEKCGSITYNPKNYKCEEASLLNLCGTEWYKPDISKYCFNGSLKEKETFTDIRDGKIYKYVEIGTQTWMAENLNLELPYEPFFSMCYDHLESNCDKYGRLYNWTAAGGMCPEGWHLPTAEEWITLLDYVENGEEGSAGRKLKAAGGWGKYSNGTDEFGFSILPGGMCFFRNESESFDSINEEASIWTNSRREGEYQVIQAIHLTNDIYRTENEGLSGIFSGDYLSIRCIKD